MKRFNKKALLILLIILVMFNFMFNKKEEKVVVLDDVKVVDNNTFGIYLKDEDNYTLYEGSDLYPEGYVLEKSECEDMDGIIHSDKVTSDGKV